MMLAGKKIFSKYYLNFFYFFRVHTRYKQDICYRLSRAGLAVAYGQQVEFEGPIVQTVAYSNNSETVNITYTAVSNIDLRNPHGFEVCCLGTSCLNDYVWVPSIISNKNGLTITVAVNSSCVGRPLYGIRYLWHETPCLFKQAAMYSATDSNLPSPPYLKIF